jgi:DnaJ-domain-containing protein 1
MSISKRLFDLARSELNSLLDKAVDAEKAFKRHKDPDEDPRRRQNLDQLSDAELEAEIERRYRARQAEAARARAKPAAASSSASSASAGRAGRPRPSSPPPPPPRRPAPNDELRQAYAALEVPYGADFATVRKSYRALMRKYHPDRHTGSPEKQKTATELAQKLSAAYQLIEQRMRK